MKLDFSFLVLCPEYQIGTLRTTVNSIKAINKKANITGVIRNTIPQKDAEEIKTICNYLVGGESFISILNIGLKNAFEGWNSIVIGGTIVSHQYVNKMSLFIENENDILYPLAPEKDMHGKIKKVNDNFIDGTLNGALIHKTAISKLPEFEEGVLEVSKTFWSAEARDAGMKFKAILGARII